MDVANFFLHGWLFHGYGVFGVYKIFLFYLGGYEIYKASND